MGIMNQVGVFRDDDVILTIFCLFVTEVESNKNRANILGITKADSVSAKGWEHRSEYVVRGLTTFPPR